MWATLVRDVWFFIWWTRAAPDANKLVDDRHRKGCTDKRGRKRSPIPSFKRRRRSGQKPFGFWPLLLRVLWRCPTLPQPIGCSTIGAAGLSFQVRNGGWAFPRGYDHHKMVQPVFTLSPVVVLGVVLVVIRIVATSTLSCLSTIRCIRLWLKCLLVSAH